MAKPRRSFGEKRSQSKKQVFVGREDQLQQFQKNIKLGPDSEDFLNIFNVFGQGGVGKTTLIKRYQKIAKSEGYLTVFIDTEDRNLYNVTATMNAIAEAYTAHGVKFERFTKRYKDFLQKKGVLDADPDKPKDTFGKLAKGGVKTIVKAGTEFIPGVGFISEYLPTDAVAEFTSEWINYALKKFGNKDDVELLRHPLKVLTPLWLEDIFECAAKKNVAFFFDTYETANPNLDFWLLELLKEKFGKIPDNFLLIISGRKELAPERWNDFGDFTMKIPLKPFTESEARNYLVQKGITSETTIKAILSISGCLPVYLSLQAEGDPSSPDDIFDPNEKVVERFLKHIKDPIKRKLALQAALPRKINGDIIQCLLNEDANIDSNVLFEWLKDRPFVQKRGGHWAYHPEVRAVMLRHQKELSETDWENVHLQLANWYQERAARLETESNRDKYFEDENWRLLQIEKHFHLLCYNYKKYIPELIRDFVTIMRRRGTSATNPLVATLIEVEEICKNSTWGKILHKGVSALMANMEEGVLKMLRTVNDKSWLIGIKNKSFFYYGQGIYEKFDPKKIESYEKAIEINPEYADAYINFGNVLKNQGKLDEAISKYEKVIEINPEDTNAWHSIGWSFLLFDKPNLGKAKFHLMKAWELSKNQLGTAPMNLGHVDLLEGNKEQAISWYQMSIPLWNEKEKFFEGMEEDYVELKMANRGISKEDYAAILQKLKEE